MFQLLQLPSQQLDVLLLAGHDLVEVVHQVFGKAGLDLQLGHALLQLRQRRVGAVLFGVLRLLGRHAGIGPQKRGPA